MAAPMKRGANVALTREIPGLSGVVLGVRWNAGGETVLDDSMVMATILCDAGGKALSEKDFVFFNQLASRDLSVHRLEHALGGDKEQVEVSLAAVPAEVDRVVVVAYVNDGPAARRTLGQLRSCEVRVLDLADNRELVRSEDLAAALDGETALTLAELYRLGGDWKFRVLGQGYAGGISALAKDYGLTL
jgi:tellurium resistance protein TerD